MFQENILECKVIYIPQKKWWISLFIHAIILVNIYELHSWAPFYLHGLTLISAWISNYIHYNIWDEITYPFLNFNRATVEV